MADFKTVEPDLSFIRDVRAAGGDSLKKCFQCATCSVVCNLSPDENPYPRKEMIWAQWGMADRLAGDSHVWLCHQCNDCSTRCPRGAKPAEVMGGIRSALIKRNAVPRFAGDMVNSIAFLPVLLVAAVGLLLGAMSLFGPVGIPSGEIEYAHFVPHGSLYVLFGGGFGLMALSVFISGRRFWRNISENTAKPTGTVSVTTAVVDVVKEFLGHSRFRECAESRTRSNAHLAIFYGFAGLFIVTSIVAPLAWFGLYPLSLWHPLKIFGNVAGIALLVGALLIIMDRADREEGEKHSYFDWFFLINILVLGATGMLLMLFRLVTQPEVVSHTYAAITYGTYFVHLITVFFVILLLPFSKFAHMVYRFLALVHARMAGIELGRKGTVEKAA